MVVGAALLALVLMALVAGRFMHNPDDVSYEEKVNVLNRATLTKLQQEAKHGKAEAQYALGHAYWQNAEYPQAFPWIKAAAAQGHADAEYLLGMAYLNGRGTLQNYHLAMQAFTQSAEQGHLEAEYRLGILYRDGLGASPNKEAAYLWLNIAAASGHEDALLYRDKLAAVMSTVELNRAQEASTQTHSRLTRTATDKL